MSLLHHTTSEQRGLIDTPGAGVVLSVSLAERAVTHVIAAVLWRQPVRLTRDTSIGEVRDLFAEGPLQLVHSVLEERL